MRSLIRAWNRDVVVADAIASYLQAIALALDARGVPGAPLFRELDIRANPFGGPLERVPTTVVATLLHRAVAVTGDPLFGLEVARHMHARNMHALASALLVSSSLREFCTRLARFWRFWTSSSSVRLVEGADGAYLEFYNLIDATAFESEDATLGYVVRLMHEASDHRFLAKRIEMRRPCPPDGGLAHRTALSCPVEFGFGTVRILFDAGDLDAAWPGGSREVAKANEDVVIHFTSRLSAAALDVRLLRVLIERFAIGPVAKAAAARELNMSTSALRHGLAKLGTSYSAIVETARADLAMANLEDGLKSIKEVAFRLGFSSPSNFSRAFKRWTGMSPLQFRATAMRGEDSTAGTPS